MLPPLLKENQTILALFSVPPALAILILARPKSWRRYSTADYITPPVLKSKLWGRVTSVGDSDNFRFYHTPLLRRILLPFQPIPTTPRLLKDQTIHVRLAGVDAPEAAHFGMPAQAGSAEAKKWLRNQVLNKKVSIIPLRKDQYGRLVSMVYIRPWYSPFRRNVSLEMLRTGHATLYEQFNAEYGDMESQFRKALAKAQSEKRGIWSQKNFVPPSKHKEKHLRSKT
ncbi:putative endonuclease lcl3 [Rhizophlyctis rosea]|nr:putative endonuclease lcl3 [Rhizophlyctis rosea]